MRTSHGFFVLFYLAMGSFFLGIAIQQVLVFSLLLYQLVSAIPRGGWPHGGRPRYSWPVLLFLAATVISALAFQAENGFRGNAEFYWALIAFYCIRRHQIPYLDWSRLFYILVTLAVPGLLIALWVALSGKPIRFLQFEWINGFLPNPSHFAEGYCLAAAWCLAYLHHCTRKREGMVLFAALFLLGWLFFINQNASGLISLMGLLIVFFASLFLKPRSLVRWMPLFLLVSLAIHWYLGMADMQRKDYVANSEVALSVFNDHPLLGTSHSHFSDYLGGDPKPPNLWLALLAEFGILGLACFLPLMIALIRRAFLLSQWEHEHWVVFALALSLFNYFQFSFLTYNLGNTSILLLYLLHWSIMLQWPQRSHS